MPLLTPNGPARARDLRRKASRYFWGPVRFRFCDFDIDVRQSGWSFLCLAAGIYHTLDRRRSVLLLHGALWRAYDPRSSIAINNQCRDRYDSVARHRCVLCLHILHRHSVYSFDAADAAVGAGSAGDLFRCDRLGVDADRKSQIRRPMVFFGHPSMGWRWYFLRFCSLADWWRYNLARKSQSARGHREGRRPAGHARHRGIIHALRQTWARTEMTGMRVVGLSVSRAPGILHGNDVPARIEYMAPPHGASAVFLEREWSHVDVRIGGDGFVDRIWHS